MQYQGLGGGDWGALVLFGPASGLDGRIRLGQGNGHSPCFALPGLCPTFLGGIIGAIWAFIDGAIAGAIIAWVYNKVAPK